MSLRDKLWIECPRPKGGYLEELPENGLSQEFWLDPKEDGERLTLELQIDGCLPIGRRRYDERLGVEKAGGFRILEGVPRWVYRRTIPHLSGTVLDGEITEKIRKDGTIDKCTRLRKEGGWFTGITVWDCLVWKGKDVRHLSEEERFKLAKQAVQAIAHPKIRMIERMEATQENLDWLFEIGYEGGVIKKKGSSIPKGARTNPNWWKIKGSDRRTVDAFIIGVSQGKDGGSPTQGIKPKPNGKVATFTMGMYNEKGEVIDVAKMSGMPEQVMQKGWKDFSSYRGRVVEMKVSGWDGEQFRWPMFKRWRDDKGCSDCRLDEQVASRKRAT